MPFRLDSYPEKVCYRMRRIVCSSLLFVLAAFAPATSSAQPALSQLHAHLESMDGSWDASKVRRLLTSEAWARFDPEIRHVSDLKISVRHIGERVWVRAVPMIDGKMVEGADRRFALSAKGLEVMPTQALRTSGRFVLSQEQATARAAAQVPASLFIDPTVERVGAFARPVWVSFGESVRAAYRVRVPTFQLRDLADVWVDAENGKILRLQKVAKFDIPPTESDAGTPDDAGTPSDAGDQASDASITDAATEEDAGTVVVDAGDGSVTEEDAGPPPAAPTAAKVFRFAPSPNGVNAAELVEVQLQGLRDAEVGGYLRGELMETYNCCKEYVCLDGSAECEMAQRRCARDDDEDPITSMLELEFPGDLLPAPLNQIERLYAKTAFCSELPRLRSTDEGWMATPVDQTRAQNSLAGLASEEDAFAELQAYYATMEYFAHIREVLEDPTFCLGGDSMQCDENGSPTLDDEGNPVRPFHIAVNVLLPELDFQAVGTQLLAGKGRTPGDPLLIEDYQRLDNAAFVPALEEGPVQVPPEFAPLLDVFNRPYDSNIYFQGARDFAYDGDIVAHEFTHALVHSFNPNLRSVAKDKWGSNADPGGMNEGWSDYFSASFLNDSQTGEYGAAGITGGELGLRDADNTKRCPDNIIGQVHNDSEPFSGALWDIRRAVLENNADDVNRLDQALLAAMAAASEEETMAQQAQRVMDEVENAFDAELRTVAEEAFAAHNLIACERVWNLSTLDDDGKAKVAPQPTMAIPGTQEIGLENVAPAPLQLRIEVPAGSASFTLSWQQGGGGLGGLGGQQEPAAMLVLAQESDTPFEWAYEGAGNRIAQPYNTDGSLIVFDANDASLKATTSGGGQGGAATGQFEVTLTPDPCASRIFYAQVLSDGAGTQLSNIDVAFAASDEVCADPGQDAGPVDTDPPAECGCHVAGGDGAESDPAFFLAGLAVVGALSLRRRRRKMV